jgi:hypothetical protein
MCPLEASVNKKPFPPTPLKNFADLSTAVVSNYKKHPLSIKAPKAFKTLIFKAFSIFTEVSTQTHQRFQIIIRHIPNPIFANGNRHIG